MAASLKVGDFMFDDEDGRFYFVWYCSRCKALVKTDPPPPGEKPESTLCAICGLKRK